jgi:hypothetical protein
VQQRRRLAVTPTEPDFGIGGLAFLPRRTLHLRLAQHPTTRAAESKASPITGRARPGVAGRGGCRMTDDTVIANIYVATDNQAVIVDTTLVYASVESR